jgi:dethiobiotin synthetase
VEICEIISGNQREIFLKMKTYFVTGIGTGIGKTFISAILCEALQADYWKPVQCGSLDNTDSNIVQSLLSNKKSKIHPETYKLKTPASPHYAASLENIFIDPDKIILPETRNTLVIEGAGGLMVPLNDNFLMIDLIKRLDAEVILVIQNYLGSINHTLLSLESLKKRNVNIKGVVFNGETQPSSEKYILNYSKVTHLFSLPYLKTVDKNSVKEIAGKAGI